MWIPILLGVVFAFLILWYLNRQVSYFNSGLGDRMPQEGVAPPPMADVERVMNQQDEYQWKRVKIEGTDALLVGVGLEQWHGESKSIMDAAQPGSMADWLRVHEMGPSPGEPQSAKEKGKEEEKERAESSTPFTGGGMASGTGGMVGGGYTPSSGGFGGGFVSGPTNVPGAAPGVAPPPSAAQLQQQALAAWQAQQQVGADTAAQQAAAAAIQTQVTYFTTLYSASWLPAQTTTVDTPAKRSAFITEKTQMTSAAMANTPLSQTATRTQLYNQMQALQTMSSGWASGSSPAPPIVAPVPAQAPASGDWTVFYSNDPANPVDIGEAATNAAFANSKILKRESSNSDAAHKTIYYQRITPIPSGTSIYKLMTNVWASAGNQLGTDYNLYSSMEDLKAGTNAWKFCNYDDTGAQIGAFRDCAPGTTGVAFQWFSNKTGWSAQNSRQATFSVYKGAPIAATTQAVFGNNGTVSCATYCAGIAGAPWNNELPVAWGGATCASAGKTGNIPCTTVGVDPATPGQLQCVCQKSPSTPWNPTIPPWWPNFTWVGEGGCTDAKGQVKQTCRQMNADAAGQQTNGCWHCLKRGVGTITKANYPKDFLDSVQ